MYKFLANEMTFLILYKKTEHKVKWSKNPILYAASNMYYIMMFNYIVQT